jgi:hypothetical protein
VGWSPYPGGIGIGGPMNKYVPMAQTPVLAALKILFGVTAQSHS